MKDYLTILKTKAQILKVCMDKIDSIVKLQQEIITDNPYILEILLHEEVYIEEDRVEDIRFLVMYHLDISRRFRKKIEQVGIKYGNILEGVLEYITFIEGGIKELLNDMEYFEYCSQRFNLIKEIYL